MRRHRDVYQNKLMVGFLAVCQLLLMRVFLPMVPANWREIWWSNVSFCPEAVFHHSLVRYGLAAGAFLVIYIGLSLREERGQKPPAITQ